MVILMGVSGAGKSVQGQRLANERGWPWIAVGELLRQHASPEMLARMSRGELIPDSETEKILEAALRDLDLAHDECIIDGFPRTVAQAEWFIGLERAGRIRFTAIVHMVVSREVVMERLLQRHRIDDTPEAIERRFSWYEKNILPIIELFKKEGLPVHDVDGVGTIDEVHDRLLKVLPANEKPNQD